MEAWKEIGWVPDSDDDDLEYGLSDSFQSGNYGNGIHKSVNAVDRLCQNDDDLNEVKQGAVPTVGPPLQTQDEEPGARGGGQKLSKLGSSTDNRDRAPHEPLEEDSEPNQHGIEVIVPLRKEQEISTKSATERGDTSSSQTSLSQVDLLTSEAFADSSESPLSSLSSSPLQWPGSPIAGPVSAESHNGEIFTTIPSQLDDTENDLSHVQLYQGDRNLRQRKLIQLHPYEIEGARYKRLMHARGIQAVRIQQERDRSSDVDANESSEEIGSQLLRAASPASSLHSIPDPDMDGSESLPLPLLTSHPRGPELGQSITAGQRSLKRPKKFRKLSHGVDSSHAKASARDSMHQGAAYKGMQDTSSTAGVKAADGNVMTMMPPIVRSNGFRVPPRLPGMNSNATNEHPDAQAAIELESEGPSQDRPIPVSAKGSRRKRVVESSSDSDAPRLHEGSWATEAAIFKKRTRGVLPASWTTLNMQQATDNRKKQSRAYKNLDQSKGIAKRIRSRGLQMRTDPNTATSLFNIFSDDEEDSPQIPGISNRARLDSEIPPSTKDDWPDSDDMEDNFIDQMVQREARLEPEEGKQPDPVIGGDDHLKPHSSDNKQRFRRSRLINRPNKLSILDNAHVLTNGPKFLQVAVRTVRRLPAKGRTSPSRKVFQFEDQDDNDEVQEMLRQWHRNTESNRSHQDEELNSEDEEVQQLPLNEISINPQTRTAQKRQCGSNGVSSYIVPAVKKFAPLSDGRDGGRTSTTPRVRAEFEKMKQPSKPRRKVRAREADLAPMKSTKIVRSAHQLDERLKEHAYRANKAKVIEAMASRASKRALESYAGNGPTATLNGLQKVVPAQLLVPEHSVPEQSRIRYSKAPLAVVPLLDSDAISKSYHEATSLHPVSPAPTPNRQRRKRVPREKEMFSAVGVVSSHYDRKDAPAELSIRSNALSDLDTVHFAPSASFGIEPLLSGLHLPENTFVGSGSFARQLSVNETSPGPLASYDSLQTPNWTYWNETVRVAIHDGFDTVKAAVVQMETQEPIHFTTQPNPLKTLEEIAWYLKNRVCFSDSVDRNDLIERFAIMLQDIQDAVLDKSSNNTHVGNRDSLLVIMVSIFARLLLISHHLQTHSLHDIVTAQARKICRNTLSSLYRDTGSLFVRPLLKQLRRYVQISGDLSSRSRHLTPELIAVAEDTIIFSHIARAHTAAFGNIWRYLSQSPAFLVDSIVEDPLRCDIISLENRWHDLFSLLPLLTLNDRGVKSSANGLHQGTENWPLVRQLIKPVLDGYRLGLSEQRPAYNTYCRALFSRCFDLISRWGWTPSDSILGFLFDFFAQNSLFNLKGEIDHGFSNFTENLKQLSRPQLTGKETCFEILLKIIALSIKILRECAPERRIGNLVWRLIPNHDRRHPREKEVFQEDLDATKNHHDLLCTLYWAAPSHQRPSLKLIRHLVENDHSHSEAYHINIHAWSNLVQYQISNDCTHVMLQPFTEWISDLLIRLIQQHASAKVEIESQAREAEASGGLVVNNRTQERAIEANQKQIEATISDLLHCLQKAVSACPSQESASMLLPSSLSQLLSLRNKKQNRLDRAILEGVKAIELALKFRSNAIIHIGSQQERPPAEENEDSQGFDWTNFEIDAVSHSSTHAPELVPPIYNALHELLASSISDIEPRLDDLLVGLVRTWAMYAVCYVRSGSKSWNNYLGPYGHDSWEVIGGTPSKRKMSPLFFALIIENSPEVFHDYSQTIMTEWLISLADRESHLRYQGQLTAQLMEHAASEPLLRDLVEVLRSSEKSEKSIELIINKRIDILSTVFNNMRTSATNSIATFNAQIRERTSDYEAMLRALMSFMQQRFQELAMNDESQNTYVTFVQNVVGALQEHAQDICPVDKFFTDSAAFPLPLEDPEYVSNRLKGYMLRLQDSANHKQVAKFIQATIERAIYDRKQDDVVRALAKAARSTESGPASLTLRSILLQSVLPAVLSICVEDDRAALFLYSVLDTVKLVLCDLFKDMDACSQTSVDGAIVNLESALGWLLIGLLDTCLIKGTQNIAVNCGTKIMATVNEALPLIEYLVQLDWVALGGRLCQQVTMIVLLCRDGGTCTSSNLYLGNSRVKDARRLQPGIMNRELDVFLRQEVRSSLRNIELDGKQYSAFRNPSWKIVATLSDDETMRSEMIAAVDRLEARLRRLPYLEKMVERANAKAHQEFNCVRGSVA